MKKVPLIAFTIVCISTKSVLASALPADDGINWKLSASEIQTTCASAIKTAQDQIASIEKSHPKATSFEQLATIENLSADMSDALIAQVSLAQIAPAKDVRDASNDCSEKVSEFGTRLSADPVIYGYAKVGFDHAPDANGKQLAKIYLEQGRRTGAALPAAKRKQVTTLLDRLTKLQIDFAKQLAEEQPVMHITDDEAKSLPADFLSPLKRDESGYVVPVNESTTTTFETQESSSDARRRFAVIYDNRGGAENVARLAEAVKIRDQVAHLVGFKSWADYQLDSKVAKTPQRALDLLKQVDDASLPKAHVEVEQLAKLKVADGDPSPFSTWDARYYQEQLEKSKYAVDANEVRQYFPVTKVIPALLSIYQKLLGVTFEPIDPPDVWAPGVLEFDIVDTASHKPIGWFYFDLYPRDGKYTHFATFPMRSGRLMADGSYQRPVGAIVGNWPVAAPGQPSLLSHYDVTTFFHEFGHLMHDTLTRAPTESLAGTNVRNDFVEAPSQMLENWMWEPSILKEVSSNVATGAPMPDDLIARVIALRHLGDGRNFSAQAFYATYDMKLHSSGPNVDPTALWFDLEPKLTVFPAIPGTVPEAGFGHLMSGYDAGYYGYLWSLVYAQDMFTMFKKGGLENPEVGMRYRKIILEKGATEEPDQLIREFLGRPVDISAFDEYIGVTPNKP
jgi:thimet oligopeptidase